MIPPLHDNFRHYIVGTPSRDASHNEVETYEIPLNEPLLKTISRITNSQWIEELISDPSGAWEDRIRPRPNAPNSEQIISSSLQKFEPASILIRGGTGWCGFVPRESNRNASSLYFLGERSESNPALNELIRLGFNDPEDLAGFLGVLSGFHESARFFSGSFYNTITAAHIISQRVVDERYIGCELKAGWDPCVIIFASGGGDPILVNRRGNVAWWEYGDFQIVRDFCESITELADRLALFWNQSSIKYSSNGTAPRFDPYTSEKSRPYR